MNDKISQVKGVSRKYLAMKVILALSELHENPLNIHDFPFTHQKQMLHEQGPLDAFSGQGVSKRGISEPTPDSPDMVNHLEMLACYVFASI